MATPSVPPSRTPLFQEPEQPEPTRPPSAGAVRSPAAPAGTGPTTGTDPAAPATDPATLVVVDGANVVGSVPDGWWRDRAGAATRLRDSLATVPGTGLPGIPAPVEVVLVVEGRARDIPHTPGGVRLERATGSGDDLIVELVRQAAAARRTVVVTADRGLRDRVTALGAEVRGPSAVPR